MRVLDAQAGQVDTELEFLLSAALTAKLEQSSFLSNVDVHDEPVSDDDVDERGILAFLVLQSSWYVGMIQMCGLKGSRHLNNKRHVSSLGFRITEFVVPLFLITYFSDTLLPNAIYGFISCGKPSCIHML